MVTVNIHSIFDELAHFKKGAVTEPESVAEARETPVCDPPTQSHMAIEVGGQDLHKGCPIPKPVLSTEPEPLQHWRYQLTPVLPSGKGGFRPLGNICKGDLGEAGVWFS